MENKISIVVPVYNVEEYLERCVDSLLGQTYQNMEIILVDDCSTDGSGQLAKKYAEDHMDKCRFVQREQNGGLAAARNSGIAIATGSYITFVDSDDWVSKDYLQVLLEIALADDADIVTASLAYTYPDGHQDIQSLAPLTTASSQSLKLALIRSYACGRLYRMAFFRESGLKFPTNVKRAEDMGVIIPLFSRSEKLSFLDKPLYYYWQRSSSLSNANQKGIDISFYDTAFQNILDHIEPGFEKEMEFRAVSELMYGKIMIMVRSGRGRREIAEQVESFNRKYPMWRQNPYLSYLPKGKRIFIGVASKKQLWCLKLLIWAWDRKSAHKG